MDPCRWASCSLFADLDTVAKKRAAFKKLRKYGYAAQIKIASGSGFLLENRGHIDFWMFDTFDPIAAIVQVKDL
jgi:hypothetical protein